MPSLLNLESVTLAHGARRILDGVSLGVEGGDRVGVVGRNGDGKSTLLRVLSGRQEPDSGRVTHAGSLRLQMLDQHDTLDPGQSVRQAVVGDVQNHVWASQARTRDVIAGLFGDLEATDLGGLDAPVATLSGGQRRRVALAGLLAVPQDRPEDVLVLDEPTNHLDVEGVDWLARHLRTRWPTNRGALVVVTHDRWFLDEVCTRTWEVHGGDVEGYDGGYAAYVLARAERNRQASASEDRRQNLLRKELAWLRRGAPARTSKPKFRIEAASDLIADVPPPRDPVELTRLATSRLGKDVLDLEDVTLVVGGTAGGGSGVEQRKVLLDDVTWRLGPGDRVGVVGVNGSGKTTLMRLLTGELRPGSGRVRRGSTVRVAMLTQEVRELDEVDDLRVVEAVERERRVVRIGDREVSASQLVERLGFARERQWTRVSELSGGERRRLQLLRLLIGEPNVLLLDEPTNDLDVDTLAEVEDLLDGWPGTLVVVSHDRYLLERVCDRQVAMLGDGAVRDLPGGVEQYLELRRAATADRTAGHAPPATTVVNGTSVSAGAGSTAGSEPSAGELRDARKELARIERRLSRIATEEDGVHEEMAVRATDHEAVSRLAARLRELHTEREQLEGTWLELAEISG